MKVKFYFIIGFTCVGIIQSLNAQVNLSQGLVAYYPFNGNANDESGNGFNGTVSNAVLTNDRFGVDDKAYNFNGTSSVIQADITSIPLGNTSRTISVWARGNDDKSQMTIAGYGDAAGTAYDAFDINYFKYSLLAGHGSGIVIDFDLDYLYSDSTFYDEWKHIVAVYDDQTSSCSLYINNSLISSELLTLNTLNVNDTKFNIGAKNVLSGLWRYFEGDIDDVCVYNRALNQEEITALYNGANPVLNIFSQEKHPDFLEFQNIIGSSTTRIIKIHYLLNTRSYVDMSVYDMFGRKLNTIISDYVEQGDHYVQLDISGFSAGVYYIYLSSNRKRISKPLVVIQ